jgi:hypothetical protein
MSDEVIADLSRYGGGAEALPLFSFSAHVLQPRQSVRVVSSFETHRFAMLLRMRSPNPHGEEHGNAARLEP